MIKHKKVVNHIGWVMGVLVSVLYFLCQEPSLSFWDSGEYILTSSKLQVGHPPGSPLYQILGAFISIFSFSNAKLIPILVNSLSAICSGATIIFLFWIIVRLMYRFSERYISNIMAGVIGALVFAFSTTFWNSAIESEVYSLSILLSTIILWIALKWDETPSSKWIIFMVFLFGLSVGVHLLSLLILPAVALIVYFHYKKGKLSGIITTTLIAIGIIVLLLWIIIPQTLKLISLSPILIISLMAFLIIGLLAFSIWKKLPILNTITLCILFFFLGFSTYFVIVIRANSNTPINQFNPNNAERLIGYLSRDAYGKTPLFYGPSYTAIPPKDFKQTENGLEPIFDRVLMMPFPRVWNYNNPLYEIGYVDWIGVPQDTVIVEGEIRAKPSWIQNLQFFTKYQVGFMYSRYLLWNFVGKSNDNQGFGNGDKGEWISGISIVDNFFGKEKSPLLSKSEKKTRNIYYGIPLLLALIGIFFHIGKDIKGWFVLVSIFLFMGVAIVVYSNEYAYQPRERDYIYVGSFMIVSIWVALGAFALSQWLVNMIRVRKPKYVLPSFLIVPALMFANNLDDHNRSHRYTAHNFASSILRSCDQNAILFVNGDNDTFPLWYMQEVEGVRTDVRVINLQLLNNPDYIKKLTTKTYLSDPILLLATEKAYRNPNRNICFVNPSNRYLNIKEALSDLYNDNKPISMGKYNFFALPSNKLLIPTNSNKPMEVNIRQTEIAKNAFILYDIIASNITTRPIYFSTYSTDDFLHLEEYLSNEGFLYRLKENKNSSSSALDSKSISINTEANYNNLIHNYTFKNFDKPGVYYDQLHRSIIETYLTQGVFLSKSLINENKPEKSLAVCNLLISKFPLSEHNYPFIHTELALVYGQLEQEEIAKELIHQAIRSFEIQMNYYITLSPYQQSQLRLGMQELVGSWISYCDNAEEYNLEELRIELADNIFDYLPTYLYICKGQLERLEKKPEYYSEEISQLRTLISAIYSFGKKYEEPLPEINY